MIMTVCTGERKKRNMFICPVCGEPIENIQFVGEEEGIYIIKFYKGTCTQSHEWSWQKIYKFDKYTDLEWINLMATS